jgi:hypothetical protein
MTFRHFGIKVATLTHLGSARGSTAIAEDHESMSMSSPPDDLFQVGRDTAIVAGSYCVIDCHACDGPTNNEITALRSRRENFVTVRPGNQRMDGWEL